MDTSSHPPDIRNDRDGETTDIDSYRAAARLSLRMSLIRGGLIAIVAYIVTAGFNLGESIASAGWNATTRTAALKSAFLLDTVPVLEKQIPVIIFPIAGALALAGIATATARIRYELGRRRYKRDLAIYRAALWNERMRTIKGVTEDPLEDRDELEKWLQEKLRQDTKQRHMKLREIDNLFQHDELLMSETANIITRRKIGVFIVSTILVAIGTAAGTRILELLSQR